MLQKIFWKSIDRQNFLHIDSDHPKSLKDSISYGQALRIKRIYTTLNDFNHYCEELKQRCVSQGYRPQLINKHIKAIEKIDRKKFLKERDHYMKSVRIRSYSGPHFLTFGPE